MLIMSVGWDYAPELRPPTGLLFITQVNPTSSHLVANQEELAKKIMNLALRSIFVHISKEIFNMP
jgi:hypothetical protein